MYTYEFATFGRAVLVSLGAGLLVGAMGYFIMRPRPDWQRKRPVLFMALGGCALLSIVIVSVLWPYLVTVPRLDGLSRDRAEETLIGLGLLADARPQYSSGVELGRVVPTSQAPSAGQQVRPGTQVSFAVAAGQSDTPRTAPQTSDHQTPALVLFEPKAHAKILATRRPDGSGAVSVRGTSKDVDGNRLRLLLWLRPVNPPSETPGWYLQQPPSNGVAGVAPDGAWQGVAQVGNSQWPPQEGAVIDLAVSVADQETVSRLMAEGGVLVRQNPVGVVSAQAAAVVLTFKAKR